MQKGRWCIISSEFANSPVAGTCVIKISGRVARLAQLDIHSLGMRCEEWHWRDIYTVCTHTNNNKGLKSGLANGIGKIRRSRERHYVGYLLGILLMNPSVTWSTEHKNITIFQSLFVRFVSLYGDIRQIN